MKRSRGRDPIRGTALGATLLAAVLAGGCAGPVRAPAVPATFQLARPAGEPLRFVVYGDMRFTATSERVASVPTARQALIARIATERPAAVLLTGDVPWHGGTLADYEVFRDETAAWRTRGLAVYPALGNHEFSMCAEGDCLDHWWNAFPALRGRRWYSVAMGPRLVAIALDSDAPLVAGAAQRQWLDAELERLPSSVEFVVIFLHHPPVADVQGGAAADHNPRPNEVALVEDLEQVSGRGRLRFVVCGGHIHNYERHEQAGIVYLVSGGGGARPYEVVRDAADLYAGPSFPNFHFLRFTLDGGVLRGEMLRLEDYDAAAPGRFERRDAFELRAAPR
jgi:hypothetical protein